ncbi:lipocalin family protein [Alcanivorax sp. JB21]|nr:lipocalin family protein [Alcanivorax limicola]
MRYLPWPAKATIIMTLTILAGLSACSRSHAPLPVVEDVDLQRYTGTWYEIARLPQFFQRGCYDSTADYVLLDDRRLQVINSCQRVDDEPRQATGIAEVVDSSEPARLRVRFDTWISRLLPRLTEGDYWILYLDENYQLAMVGAPNRDYLWFLARTPDISARDYALLEEHATALGFAVDELHINRELRPQ